MTVKELISLLEKVKDEDSRVYFTYVDESTGCDTCGYGASQIEEEVSSVDDLDGKIWLR